MIQTSTPSPAMATNIAAAQRWLRADGAAVSLVLEVEGTYAAVSADSFELAGSELEAQAISDRLGEEVVRLRARIASEAR
jgi:hypothetical protein